MISSIILSGGLKLENVKHFPIPISKAHHIRISRSKKDLSIIISVKNVFEDFDDVEGGVDVNPVEIVNGTNSVEDVNDDDVDANVVDGTDDTDIDVNIVEDVDNDTV